MNRYAVTAYARIHNGSRTFHLEASSLQAASALARAEAPSAGELSIREIAVLHEPLFSDDELERERDWQRMKDEEAAWHDERESWERRTR